MLHPRFYADDDDIDEMLTSMADDDIVDSVTHIAAGVIITADNTGRTLFVRRSGTGDQAGTWAFPGGAVEPGETVEQAAARETREEIGYDPSDDMEQAHRASTNDVDFTTYMHTTAREFRPHLNNEHDAYKWTLIEQAPEPLHPGVRATLQHVQMGDESSFDPEDHPRDKDGKFTSAGGSGAALDKVGTDVGHVADLTKAEKGTDSGYDEIEVPFEHSHLVQASLDKHGLESEKLYKGFTKNGELHDLYMVKGMKPAATPQPQPAAVVEHPSQKWLSSVKANGAERVAWKKDLQTTTDPVKRKELQEKIVASFWKQHGQVVKKGTDLEKKQVIEDKIAKYAKSYGIANPLKQAAPPASKTSAPTFGKSAPQPLPAHPDAEPITFSSLKKVGEQKGSNPGGVYEDAHGQKFYVKTMDEAHAKNELLAAKLYALTGAKTLDYVPVKPDGDVHYVATKFEALDKDNVSKLSPAERHFAQRDFATHAWTANWDAAGTGGDNQGVKGGIVKTLDVGGALEYRAKGSPKGAAFGNSVGEFDSLRSGPSSDNNALFGKMTDEQIKDSVARVAAIQYGQIYKTVESVYGNKSVALASKLEARKNDLIARAAQIGKAPAAPDLSNMSEEEQRLHWLAKTTGAKDNSHHMTVGAAKMEKVAKMGITPAELGFVRAFTGPHSSVNAQMRDGHMDDHVFAFKHIMNEALDKFPAYDGDTLWRKINLTPDQQAKYVPGKIAHWQAFSSTAKNPDTWSGNTHFTIRNPKSGRDVQFVSEHPSEAEVIMPADTYYRVLSKKSSGGATHIELEEVLPFGKKQKKAA